jgi:hypothetical protein
VKREAEEAKILGTSSTHRHCLRAMNAILALAKEFEGCAECCLDLAQSAETTACRARFIQMAREYRLATLLMHDKARKAFGERCPSSSARSGSFRDNKYRPDYTVYSGEWEVRSIYETPDGRGHPAATTVALAVFFATFLSFDAESERWSSSILMMFSLWLS